MAYSCIAFEERSYRMQADQIRSAMEQIHRAKDQIRPAMDIMERLASVMRNAEIGAQTVKEVVAVVGPLVKMAHEAKIREEQQQSMVYPIICPTCRRPW